MSTRDSGLIDLFAIHKEEEAKQKVSVMPSAPPPAVAFDVAPPSPPVSTDDIEDFAEVSRRATRKRMKIVGGVLGAAAVIGIMVFAITTGMSKPAPAPAAAAAAPPPPTATFVPPPPPTPEPSPAASTTTASKDSKDAKDGKSDANGGYTRAAAIAAYNQQQGKKSAKVGVKAAAAPKTTGVKMQKVQSSGIPNE